MAFFSRTLYTTLSQRRAAEIIGEFVEVVFLLLIYAWKKREREREGEKAVYQKGRREEERKCKQIWDDGTVGNR